MGEMGRRATYPVDSEPFRTRCSETETRSEASRRVCSFIDVINDRFQYTEYAIDLLFTKFSIILELM
jgi:hypothetical protein